MDLLKRALITRKVSQNFNNLLWLCSAKKTRDAILHPISETPEESGEGRHTHILQLSQRITKRFGYNRQQQAYLWLQLCHPFWQFLALILRNDAKPWIFAKHVRKIVAAKQSNICKLQKFRQNRL